MAAAASSGQRQIEALQREARRINLDNEERRRETQRRNEEIVEGYRLNGERVEILLESVKAQREHDGKSDIEAPLISADPELKFFRNDGGPPEFCSFHRDVCKCDVCDQCKANICHLCRDYDFVCRGITTYHCSHTCYLKGKEKEENKTSYNVGAAIVLAFCFLFFASIPLMIYLGHH